MNLSMIRGDSATFVLQLGTDLTGASVTMTAKTAYTVADGSATFQKTLDDGIILLDENAGIIQVDLEPADTSGLDAVRTRLVFDVQVQAAGAGAVDTPVRGRLTVYPDVTTTIEEAS